jgi:hypothetical protein
MIIHFIVFHSLQTLPIIGWILDHSPIPSIKAKKITHTAGVSWLLLIIFLFIQTAIGKSVFEPTIYFVLLVLSLVFLFTMEHSEKFPVLKLPFQEAAIQSLLLSLIGPKIISLLHPSAKNELPNDLPLLVFSRSLLLHILPAQDERL